MLDEKTKDMLRNELQNLSRQEEAVKTQLNKIQGAKDMAIYLLNKKEESKPEANGVPEAIKERIEGDVPKS